MNFYDSDDYGSEHHFFCFFSRLGILYRKWGVAFGTTRVVLSLVLSKTEKSQIRPKLLWGCRIIPFLAA